MEVTLYSTHCPQCVLLERILQFKHVDYKIVTDPMEIQRVAAACKYTSVPILRVDDIFMPSADAIRWVNAYEKDEEVNADDSGQVPPVQEGPELHQEVLQCAECGVGE